MRYVIAITILACLVLLSKCFSAELNLMPPAATVPLLSPRQKVAHVWMCLPAMPGRTNIVLMWEPNYRPEDPNEVTVIVSSANYFQPMNQWAVRFIGATNQCSFPTDKPMEFFAAYNLEAAP